jgi:hypothetical protein
MIRNILIFLILFFYFLTESYALIPYTKPPKAEVDAAAKACMETGKSTDETKYICPDGSFQQRDGKVLSQQAQTCAAKMSLSFSAIDEAAKKWIAELQKQREPDFNVWSADIDKTFAELNDTYFSVCKTTTFSTPDNPQELACAKTFDFFPESECMKLARQKADAWRNAWYILAAKGIAKNAQNEKDEFVDRKKTKYSELINKWNSYKRIVANSVAKMTAYIRSPVK